MGVPLHMLSGTCALASHDNHSDDNTNNLWYAFCADSSPNDSSTLQSDDSPTEGRNTTRCAEQRREDVEDFINEDCHFGINGMVKAHDDAVAEWVGMFCLCKREPNAWS